MNLPMRQNKKRDQALDAVASVAKTWSEWRLGKRATTSVKKGAKKASKKASKLSGTTKRTPLKIAGGVALLGGIAAAVAKKLKSGTAEPLYTPPPPPVAPPPVRPAPPSALADTSPAPPKPVVVEDLAPDKDEPEPEATAEPAVESGADAKSDANANANAKNGDVEATSADK